MSESSPIGGGGGQRAGGAAGEGGTRARPPYPPASRSQVQVCGFGASSCGYCHSEAPSSVSYGLISQHLLVADYVELMLQGWRRSGNYFYRPVNHVTCCPAYTIRLRAKDFQPNKAQRQIQRRMDRYLSFGDTHLEAAAATAAMAASTDAVAIAPAHTLTFETVVAEFTDERFELYQKYQVAVHHDAPDSVTPKGFARFLVQSPLIAASGDNGKHKYGTFHQLYRLDGQLVAVGVVDLLPVGMSSVYFFYDPDQRQLVLGKYSALREIAFCQENNFEHYFMGFYIHACEKMKYKADFKPSELLCPMTHQWYPIDQRVLSALSANCFTPLDPVAAGARALVPSSPAPALPQQPSILPKEEKSLKDTGSGKGKDGTAGGEPVETNRGGGDDDGKGKSGEEIGEVVDEDNDEDEEVEEAAPDLNVEELLATSHLRDFAPTFPPKSPADYAQIELDLGVGAPVFTSQLNAHGREIVTKMLDDLTSMCSSAHAKSFVLVLR